MAWRQYKGDKAIYYEREKQGFIGSSAPEQMGANSHQRNRQTTCFSKGEQVFIDFLRGSGLKFGDCLLVMGKISKDVFLLVLRYSSLEICSIEGTQLNLGTAEILVCILTLKG